MGEFKASNWIIGLVIYFFLLFLFLTYLEASRSVLSFNSFESTVTDPGWKNQGNVFLTGGLSEHCDGTGGGRSMNFLQNIQCNQLNLDPEDYNTCNNITGCVWNNRSSFFGLFVSDPICSGIVDKTVYNITGGLNTYCQSTGLQSPENCSLFKCDWINPNNIATDTKGTSFSGNEPLGATTGSNIWNTIKFMSTFRYDLGLGYFNYIFIILFFWLPTVALVLSIYFLIPFFH